MSQDIKSLRAELKRLAEAATPGPWQLSAYQWADDSRSYANVVPANGGYSICGQKSNRENSRAPQRRADLSYIAASNPAALLALIAHIEALEAEIQKLKTNSQDLK